MEEGDEVERRKEHVVVQEEYREVEGYDKHDDDGIDHGQRCWVGTFDAHALALVVAVRALPHRTRERGPGYGRTATGGLRRPQVYSRIVWPMTYDPPERVADDLWPMTYGP